MPVSAKLAQVDQTTLIRCELGMHIKNMLNLKVVVTNKMGCLNSPENVALSILNSWLLYLAASNHTIVVRGNVSGVIIASTLEDCKHAVLDLWNSIRVFIVVSKVSCSSKKVVVEVAPLILHEF